MIALESTFILHLSFSLLKVTCFSITAFILHLAKVDLFLILLSQPSFFTSLRLTFFSITAFIIHRGRVELRLDTSDVQCKTVVFSPANFKNYMPVRVETSINYYSSNGSFVHDAAVSWAEETSVSSFQVCVLKAGRLDRLTPDSGLTYVDYIAYQSAPAGTVTGEQLMSDWWEGTTCQTVALPKVRMKML